VGASVGVVSCPEHGDDAEALLDAAEEAMYRAKALGEPVALGERASESRSANGKP
jgi:GGDEF domain-containing protein